MIKSLGNVSDYGEERQEMKMCQYDRESKKAEEFINHEEILETLRYAEENKHNEALIAQILEKAKKRKGLEHREAMVLLDWRKIRRSTLLQSRSRRIFTAIELLCSHRCIYQIIV